MNDLKPNECRVLGVLVEKAYTTPGQYPMTINAVVNGCNQKSNRDPVMHLSEDQVFDALEGLRLKGVAREVDLAGSRVSKYRQIAKEALEVTTSELVVLTELLLRGPQTIGELRGRALRMHTLESLDAVQSLLDNLAGRDTPMIRKLAPAPGSRAARFAQLICPTLHPLDAPAAAAAPVAAPAAAAPSPSPVSADFVSRLEALEAEVARLRALVEHLVGQT